MKVLTAQQLSCEWPHTRVSFTNLTYTLEMIHFVSLERLNTESENNGSLAEQVDLISNGATQKYCSIAFISVITYQDFIHRRIKLKVRNFVHCLQASHSAELNVLLSILQQGLSLSTPARELRNKKIRKYWSIPLLVETLWVLTSESVEREPYVCSSVSLLPCKSNKFASFQNLNFSFILK